MAQIQPNYDSETQALGIVGSQVRPRSMMSDYNVEDEDIFEDQIQHRTDQAIIREFEDKARCSKIWKKMAWLKLTQVDSILLNLTQLNSSWLNFAQLDSVVQKYPQFLLALFFKF